MTANSASSRPSNVIVFFTDQQRWDTLGVAGNPTGLTPNLDRMAGRGTFFEVACASNPVCAPSRSAVLTGRYPTSTGVYRNDKTLPVDVSTIGESFQSAGYRTGYIGKWHLSEKNPVPPEDRRGYDTWLASNILEFTSDAYRTVVYDNDGEAVELPGYRADAITDAAIRFIADNHDQPFFLFISLIEPHHQNEHDNYPAPEVYENSYHNGWVPPDLQALGGTTPQHISGYYGQVKRLDECLGRLRDALVSLELTDDTIVAYTSDHGSHFKTRNSEYKRSCHDGSIRVPLVFDGPGFSGGRRVSAPVSTVDLVPTLLDAAGIDIPTEVQGRVLTAIDTETVDEGVLIQVSESETGRALRTARWKYYVVAPEAGDVPSAQNYIEEALYDLDADPYELDNMIDSDGHLGITQDLRGKIQRRIKTIEGCDVDIEPRTGHIDRKRYPQTTVRYTGLRGTRFGHQSAARVSAYDETAPAALQ